MMSPNLPRGPEVTVPNQTAKKILINLECAVPSCEHDMEATMEEALKKGWRSIRVSKESMDSEHPRGRWRTHLGFCPACAEKFSVER